MKEENETGQAECPKYLQEEAEEKDDDSGDGDDLEDMGRACVTHLADDRLGFIQGELRGYLSVGVALLVCSNPWSW